MPIRAPVLSTLLVAGLLAPIAPADPWIPDPFWNLDGVLHYFGIHYPVPFLDTIGETGTRTVDELNGVANEVLGEPYQPSYGAFCGGRQADVPCECPNEWGGCYGEPIWPYGEGLYIWLAAQVGYVGTVTQSGTMSGGGSWTFSCFAAGADFLEPTCSFWWDSLAPGPVTFTGTSSGVGGWAVGIGHFQPSCYTQADQCSTHLPPVFRPYTLPVG